MTTAELRIWGKTLVGCLALIVLILGAQGLVDAVERDTEDRLAYRSWVHDACIPAHKGERVIATHEGNRLSCTIYSEYARGMVPLVVSAAVMDVPK